MRSLRNLSPRKIEVVYALLIGFLVWAAHVRLAHQEPKMVSLRLESHTAQLPAAIPEKAQFSRRSVTPIALAA